MQIKQVHERKYARENVDEWTKSRNEEKKCAAHINITQRIADDNRRKWTESEMSRDWSWASGRERERE